VTLIEKPRRALFISRLYEVPVLLNKLFPEFIDFTSETWVRRKRKNELPPSEEVAPVRYSHSLPTWKLAGGIVLLALIRRFWRRKL